MGSAVLTGGSILSGIILGQVLVPELAGHYMHLGTYSRAAASSSLTHGHLQGTTEPLASLTFDDGPDPRFTPPLLERLAELSVPATFFMVGQRALRFPQVAQAVVDAGHDVGNHTWSHRRAWGLTPAATWREVTAGARAIADVTGSWPRWLRPPWGAFNPVLWQVARAVNERIVLWSAVGSDWEARATPSSIVRRVNQGRRPGVIILLHDAGGAPAAPLQTIAALPDLVTAFHGAGYRFVTLRTLLDGVDPEEERR